MDSTLRDRRSAAAAPLIYLLLSLLLPWWSLVLLVVAYLVLGRTSLVFTREVVLKMLDLNLSILLIALGIGAFIAGIEVVARDGGLQWLSLLNQLLVKLLSLLALVYLLLSLGFTGVRAWRGQLHTPKLSMGIIEALRGRRVAAPESTQPGRPENPV